VCREFECDPETAERQDVELTDEIMQARRFVRIYEKSKRDKKSMTEEEWAFLEWVQEQVKDD